MTYETDLDLWWSSLQNDLHDLEKKLTEAQQQVTRLSSSTAPLEEQLQESQVRRGIQNVMMMLMV